MVEKKILAKVVVLGNVGVGKTTLINQYVDDNQHNYNKPPTIGTDFRKKEVKIGFTTVTLQIWDTAGQEQFNSMAYSLFRGANALVLVFDLTDRESFEALKNWKRIFFDKANPRDYGSFPVVVIGNKTDLSRRVSEEEARRWCTPQNYQYFETWGEQGIFAAPMIAAQQDRMVNFVAGELHLMGEGV